MHVNEEIRGLREALEPLLCARSYPTADSSDEQFVKYLQHYLMTIVEGANRAGFDCAITFMPEGDYLATLVWSANASNVLRKSSVGFSARGPTSTVAFLRVALKALRHPEYQQMTPKEDAL